MTNVRAQRDNKSQIVKRNAAASNSVPALRDEVVRLAEAVELQELQIQRLINQLSNQ